MEEIGRAIGKEGDDLESNGEERRHGVEIHKLRCWPVSFAALRSGLKRVEIRRNDRHYREGDWLFLQEWKPVELMKAGEEAPSLEHVDGEYTGQTLMCKVTHILRLEDVPRTSLPKGYIAMSVFIIDDSGLPLGGETT